jgi:hypothetical protein
MCITPVQPSLWRLVLVLFGCGVVGFACASIEFHIAGSWSLSLVCLTTLAALAIVAYTYLRFVTLRSLSADDSGLEVRGVYGERVWVPWEAIRVATHAENWHWEQWTLECPDREVTIRNVSILLSEWQELSELIVHEVRKRGRTLR